MNLSNIAIWVGIAAGICAILGINLILVIRAIRSKVGYIRIRRYNGYFVRGDILSCYKNPACKRLGLPISTQQDAEPSELKTTGKVQRFQGNEEDKDTKVKDAKRKCVLIGASIYKGSKYAPCPVYGKIGYCYEKEGGSGGRLGFPITYEADAATSLQKTSGRVQRFEGRGDGATIPHKGRTIKGVSIYSSKHGTYPVWGVTGRCFEKNGGTGGRLGFPISKEERISDAPKTWRQRFEGGTITCISGKEPVVTYN